MGKQHKIGDIVSNIFDKRKYSNKLNEIRLNDIIVEVFGEGLSKYFKIIQYSNNILFLKIDSIELKRELLSNKLLFINKINSCFADKIINDIEIS